MSTLLNILIGGGIYALAFIVGSIPSGFLIAYLCGIEDIRQHGSGNIGASNISRLLGWHYFVLVLFLDAGKAFLFCYFLQKFIFVSFFSDTFYYFPIFGLMVGNIRSPFLGGKGGKGVATAFGVLLAFAPWYALVFAVVWLTLVGLFRSAGLASIISIWAITLLQVMVPFAPNTFSSVIGCVAALVTMAHGENIKQLCKQWGIA